MPRPHGSWDEGGMTKRGDLPYRSGRGVRCLPGGRGPMHMRVTLTDILLAAILATFIYGMVTYF